MSFEQTFKNWLNRGKGITYAEHLENIKFVKEEYQKGLETNDVLSNELRDKTKNLITEINKALVKHNK